MEMIKRFFNDESGATMVEYAILVALLAIAVATIIITLSTELRATFQSVIDCLRDPTAANCGPATP
ncbi:MAG: Flp family type IVb pilin [Gammaproteobacteria bacterium]|nr:Flp family type IVb pilin [Gammaproteobacteria bacterium]